MERFYRILAWVLVIASIIYPSSCIRGGLISVNTDRLTLVDEDGRERIFHGTNVIYKTPPYHPSTDRFDYRYSFVEEDVMLLKKMGLNAVRLGVMWPGVEPVRGQYNSTYLQIMDGIVQMLAKYDIYTLVDMHQDDFSEKFCGEGVPPWAAIPSSWTEDYLAFPEPLQTPYVIDNATGFPDPKDCALHDWPAYYPTIAQGSAVQNLYDNYNGLLDAWGGFWQRVASTWVNTDSVLGYELINEPWAGDIFTNPALLVPGVADYFNLQPAYDVLQRYIRQVDTRHCIYFEGLTWDDIVLGFTDTPGGELYKNRSVYAYHVYIPPNYSAEQAISTHSTEVRRLQCGWFCTETGELTALPVADQFRQSWLHWDFKLYGGITGDYWGLWFPNGTQNNGLIDDLVRVYASAIAGDSISMNYNETTKEFSLLYKIKTSCKLGTEISYSPEYHYPNGFTVFIQPSNSASWSILEPNVIQITHTQQAVDGAVLSISIFKK